MKKFSKNHIFASLIIDLFYVFIIALAFVDFAFISNEEGEYVGVNYQALPYYIALLVVAYILFTVYRIIYVHTSGYQLTEREIVCNRGVLFRKKSILEYSKINSINKKQNFIQRIFGIAVLTVDSGSANMGHLPEIIVIEKNDVVDQLLNKLKNIDKAKIEPEKQEVIQEDCLYNYSKGKKFIYSLINLVETAIYVFISLVLVGAIVNFILSYLKVSTGYSELQNFLIVLLIVCLGAVGIGALSMIISVLYAFIGYYNFKIIKSENGLEISYGLLSRHTNTFKFDKICGVKITQSLTQRILGFATIRLEVIGFLEKGSNNDELTSGMLVPLCAMSEVNSILEKILPNFTVDEKTYSAPKLAPFYMWKFLIVSLSFLVPLAILWAINVFSMKINLIITVSLLMALLFTLLIIFADAIMNKKTSGITVKPDKVTTYSGGLYKKIYVIKKQAITAIEQKTTPLRYKNNIVSFTVHFRSNSHANEATAPNLDKTNYKVVENLLTF